MGKTKVCVAKFTLDLAKNIKHLPGAYILYAEGGAGWLYKFKSINNLFLVLEDYKDETPKIVVRSLIPTYIKEEKIGIILPLELKDLFTDIEIIVPIADVDIGIEGSYEEELMK